jgi:N-acetylmuramoyl-L-alanine amidase
MPLHTLAQGECALSVAARHGVPADAVWAHPRNAALRARRADLAVLLPGDELFVPDAEPAARPVTLRRRNRFVARGRTVAFRLRLLGEGGRPRAAQPYLLCVDGAWTSGRTDGDGWLEARIPAAAAHGELVLPAHEGQPPHEAEERFALAFGHLDPADEPTGARDRLRNLGFDTLGAFQAAAGLPETGVLDAATAGALHAQHGS